MITIGYLIFLILTVFIFYLVSFKFRRYVLFIASLGFIGYISIPFLLIALSISVLNYLFGILLGSQKVTKVKRSLYILSLIANIGFLVFFKYIDFFFENINVVIRTLSDANTLPLFQVLLPIGISYYTFQNLGYIYRVYKGMEECEKSFDLFVIYSLFFPKLISGPIEKSNSFLPQLRQPKKLDTEDIRSGMQLLLFGFFKKLIIADNIGIMVNTVYGSVHDYSGFALIMVLLLQPMYIYFDFSGYTDIALGAGRLFGYKLTDNFNRPFFATTVSAFWRRWHISLTSWCNDFIFKLILFKRRKWKDWGAVYAVFLAFIIIGIWHGPRWNFLILGILQGLAINYEFFTRRLRFKYAERLPKKWVNRFSRLVVYVFFSFSLVFFFMPDFKGAVYFISNIFSDINITLHVINVLFPTLLIQNYIIAFVCFITIIWIESLEESDRDMLGFFRQRHIISRWAVYAVMVLLILYLGSGQGTFVYQQF